MGKPEDRDYERSGTMDGRMSHILINTTYMHSLSIKLVSASGFDFNPTTPGERVINFGWAGVVLVIHSIVDNARLVVIALTRVLIIISNGSLAGWHLPDDQDVGSIYLQIPTITVGGKSNYLMAAIVIADNRVHKQDLEKIGVL